MEKSSPPKPVNREENNKTYKCVLCGNGFTNVEELHLHEKNVHEHQCNQCDSKFFTEYDLDIHKLNSHINKAETEKHLEKSQVECNYCPYLSRCSGESNNVKTNKSKFNCKICDFTSNSQAAFKVHIQESHYWDQSLLMSCISCEMAFHELEVCQESVETFNCGKCKFTS